MTGCGHGMPSRASCWECMEEGGLGAPRIAPPRIVGTIRAHWPSVCPQCRSDVVEGDEIVGVEYRDSIRWMHRSCAEELTS